MPKDHVSISFKCKICDTTLSWTDDIEDSTEVRSGCGALAGAYGELKEAAVNAAKDKVDQMLRDVFKRR